METNKIKALITALDTGSLMKASDVLGYTSSGITHMVVNWKKRSCKTIRDRERRGMKNVTEAQTALRTAGRVSGGVAADIARRGCRRPRRVPRHQLRQ